MHPDWLWAICLKGYDVTGILLAFCKRNEKKSFLIFFNYMKCVMQTILEKDCEL